MAPSVDAVGTLSGHQHPEQVSARGSSGMTLSVERTRVTDWDAWELGRVVLAAAGVLYAGIWAQVTLFHWGAAFASRAMWAPVIMTPFIVLAAALAVVTRQDPWGWVAAVALGIGVLDGLYGLYRHLRGTISQIGGFTL